MPFFTKHGRGIHSSQKCRISFFNEFCYLFHIQLFFICSGFLFQKYTSYTSLSDYAKNISKKLVALGVPYLFFVLLSHLFKTLFSSYVKNQSGNLLKELFVSPMPPYWFLYVLFLIFLITPTVKTRLHFAWHCGSGLHCNRFSE